MKYTDQQTEVINARGSDILVSAGAGSGKTAVLTERILQRLLDRGDPVDVDRLLVLTFTRAAASQMRQRLADKITDYLRKNPSDERMQQQENLLHNAQITTIDSFCLYLLRNHFHEVGIDPGFRIMDPGEEKLLQQDVLEEVLEDAFSKGEEDFLFLAECLNPNVREKELESSILSLAEYASSHPWPETWIGEQKEKAVDEIWQTLKEELFSLTKAKLERLANLTKELAQKALLPGHPAAYEKTFLADSEMFASLSSLTESMDDESFDKMVQALSDVKFPTIASVKKTDTEVDRDIAAAMKGLRDRYKEEFASLRDLYGSKSEKAKEVLSQSKRLTDALCSITLQFSDALMEKKLSKNILSFSDIEHLALRILYDDERKLTETAKFYQEYFAEIMVDEFQDSNEVQEILLSALAKTENGSRDRFMVGDKKQSIYRFRMARPEIFMEKYDTYQSSDPGSRLILLPHNFRSRQQVIDSVNDIFRVIMRKRIGGIEYDASEELIRGGSFPKADNEETYDTEMLLCDYDKSGREKRAAEIRVIADRIRDMKAHIQVADENCDGAFRPLRYSDICILLRSFGTMAQDLKEELMLRGIPVHMASRTGYYDEPEIRQLMELLRCLENPYHDLSFTAAMRSVFFGLSDNDLALIRGSNKDISMYESFREKATEDSPEGIMAKEALALLSELRTLARDLPLQKLLTEIMRRFRYREYLLALPAGEQRAANADMLLKKAGDFEKTGFGGIFDFIRYMDLMDQYKVEEGEAGTLSDKSDVVRIMTIHASKGLEFPVVFLSACDKRFNAEDYKQTVMMDLDRGLAADGVDPALRNKTESLSMRLMKDQRRRDDLGEELRLLYVAATRAKEKLIFTATVKDAEKSAGRFSYLKELKMLEGGKADEETLRSASGYLDCLLMAHTLEEKSFTLRIITANEIDLAAENGRESLQARRDDLQRLLDWESDRRMLEEDAGQLGAQYRMIRESFDYVYLHENLKNLYTKTSVSELKAAAMEEAGVAVMFETEDKTTPYIPAFARKDEKAGGALRGTAYHKVLELLDVESYRRILSQENGEKLAEANLTEDMALMVREDRMPAEYIDLISKEKVLAFLKTDTAARMAEAAARSALYKEQPFVIMIPAARLHKEIPEEEKIMIQGVIDVYWEEEDGFVILDYKTDRVENAKDLTDRYETQLSYYKEALSQITGKGVKECLIYSLSLSQEIHL